ncbi:hypothetical protein DFH06DRAFT_1193375 [Mycena polygramma]|nr:hypothetical protein DFH06DRAFT_1193375 [Mycena polygramma]
MRSHETHINDRSSSVLPPPHLPHPSATSMSLRKIGNDEWTRGAVTSNFEILMPHDPKASVGRDSGIVCGLGWRFSSSANPEYSHHDSDGNILPAWHILFFIDPYLVRQASYGTLSLSFDIWHLRVLPTGAGNVTTLSLPYQNYYGSDLQIFGTFVYTRTDGLKTPSIAITVKLPTNTEVSLPFSLTPKMERLLADTMNGKEAVDIKFYAFTRKRAGYATDPQAMFAKSALLEGYSDELDLLISGGGFRESNLVDLDRHRIDMGFLPLEEYGYADDSDLDSDDEDIECAEASERSYEIRSEPGSDLPLVEATEIPLPPSRPHSPVGARRMGRVVPLSGTASFQTWRALLYYLYTGKLSFSSVSISMRVESEETTPRCSAKSMYRLADQLGLHELKAVSLSSINANLSSKDIVQQVFSKFTSV